MLLLYFSVAFIGGIAAASLVHLPLSVWLWWLVLPAASLLIWRDSFPRRANLCALTFLFGALRFTLYADADHDESWTRAYADPELYAWLMQQHLP